VTPSEEMLIMFVVGAVAAELRGWLAGRKVRAQAQEDAADRLATIHRLDDEHWLMLEAWLMTPDSARATIRDIIVRQLGAIDNSLKARAMPVMSAGERARIGGARGMALEARGFRDPPANSLATRKLTPVPAAVPQAVEPEITPPERPSAKIGP
jgi:hypothetical protein